MAKSNTATVLSRVNDVGRLILSGAEFAEIRQYATDQNWKVSGRQIRRYMQKCYTRLAQATDRDRKELLGRHLMQRRAIYARSLKNGDLRTALQTLRDEAELEGLYPSPQASAEQALKHQLGIQSSPLSRRELVARQLAAEAKGDEKELAVVKSLAPTGVYTFPSTMLPIAHLHILTLVYIWEQLEQMASFLHAMWHFNIAVRMKDEPKEELEPTAEPAEESDDELDAESAWLDIGLVAAYRFRIGREAWEQFCEGIGVDGNLLVAGNYQGFMLEMGEGRLSSVAPSEDQMPEILARMGHEGPVTVKTARDLTLSWKDLFDQVCRD
jgi:hypothetical protein